MLTTKRLKTIVKVLSCLREFGLVRGTVILFQLYGRGDIHVQLPGYRAPLLLRSLRDDESDVSVFEKIFLLREYDLPPLDPAPQVIVDGGAFVGLSTVFFAHHYPSATIIAIEPDPSNYERLLANTRAYENIHPIRAALWNRTIGLRIAQPAAQHLALQVEEVSEPEAATVPALTIPDLMARFSLDHIDILKLDIECAEEKLFAPPGPAWLDQVRLIMIELHDWIRPGSARAFYGALGPYPFKQVIRGENIVIYK